MHPRIKKPHPQAVERVDKRTLHSKTFALPNGKMQVECPVGGHVHWQDGAGKLHDVDTTLDSNGVCESLPYVFTLHKKGVGFDFTDKRGGLASVALVGIGGLPFDTNNAKPTIDGDTITFADVAPGCDIVFRVLPKRVKTLRILRDANAPRSFEWLCTYDESGKGRIKERLSGWDSERRQLDLQTQTVEVDAMSHRVIETWSGKTKQRDPVTRIKALVDDVAWPVTIDPTVAYDVTANYDDGYETTTGGSHATYGYSSTKIGLYGVYSFHPFTRFLSVAVPQAATIDSATFSLNVTGKVTNYGGGTIFGYDANTVSIDISSFQVGTAPHTTATTTLTRPASTGVKNYDVTTIVQEIINRAGWVSGNNLALFAEDYESTDRVTLFEDYSDAGTTQAHLSITYTVGGGSDQVGSGAASVSFTIAGGGQSVATGSGGATATLTAAGGGRSDATTNGAATFTLTASGQGAADATGAGASTFSVAAAGVGQSVATGSGAAACTITAAGVGAADVQASGAASASFTTIGQGAADAVGSGSVAFELGAGGAGTADDTGSGAASFSFTVTGAGAVDAIGSGVASFAFTADGIGDSSSSSEAVGSGSATFSFATAGQGDSEAATIIHHGGGSRLDRLPPVRRQREPLPPRATFPEPTPPQQKPAAFAHVAKFRLPVLQGLASVALTSPTVHRVHSVTRLPAISGRATVEFFDQAAYSRLAFDLELLGIGSPEVVEEEWGRVRRATSASVRG